MCRCCAFVTGGWEEEEGAEVAAPMLNLRWGGVRGLQTRARAEAVIWQPEGPDGWW